MTNDELRSQSQGLTECPDCGSETVIVDVSEILTDPATLSNNPLGKVSRCVVHAIYCPTCDEVLSTRLIDPGTGQSVLGRRTQVGCA